MNPTPTNFKEKKGNKYILKKSISLMVTSTVQIKLCKNLGREVSISRIAVVYSDRWSLSNKNDLFKQDREKTISENA